MLEFLSLPESVGTLQRCSMFDEPAISVFCKAFPEPIGLAVRRGWEASGQYGRAARTRDGSAADHDSVAPEDRIGSRCLGSDGNRADDGMFSVLPQVMAPMGSALSKPVALFLLNTFEILHY
jgi:hypothetical protein